MLNSKERSNLLALANKLNPTVYIGKYGITESVIAQIDEMLFDHELIKIGVQRNSDFTAKECINILCEKLSAEPVHAIGSKLIIYRRSDKEGIEHIDYSGNPKPEVKAQPKNAESKKKIKTHFDKRFSKSANEGGKLSKKRAKQAYSPEKKNGVTVYKNGKRYGKK